MSSKETKKVDLNEVIRDGKVWKNFRFGEFQPKRTTWECCCRRLLNGFNIYEVPENKLVIFHVVGDGPTRN